MNSEERKPVLRSEVVKIQSVGGGAVQAVRHQAELQSHQRSHSQLVCHLTHTRKTHAQGRKFLLNRRRRSHAGQPAPMRRRMNPSALCRCLRVTPVQDGKRGISPDNLGNLRTVIAQPSEPDIRTHRLVFHRLAVSHSFWVQHSRETRVTVEMYSSDVQQS